MTNDVRYDPLFIKEDLERAGLRPCYNERLPFLDPEYMGLEDGDIWILVKSRGDRKYELHGVRDVRKKTKSVTSISTDPKLGQSKTIEQVIEMLKTGL